MAEPLVSDALWAVVEPLIPKHFPNPKGGRPRIDDRKALTGILFVLKSGIPWEMLPQEMGCGSGMSCWRRLWEWQKAGLVAGGAKESELGRHEAIATTSQMLVSQLLLEPIRTIIMGMIITTVIAGILRRKQG